MWLILEVTGVSQIFRECRRLSGSVTDCVSSFAVYGEGFTNISSRCYHGSVRRNWDMWGDTDGYGDP